MSATIDTIRVRDEPIRQHPRVLDVSDVSAARVQEYCREATADGHEVHLSHRAGRTYLVAR